MIFDGTLADTSEGILQSMHYAYSKLQLEQESDMVIRGTIGPPLEEMFSMLLHTKDAERIGQAVSYFRERYAKEGINELCLYPGVKQTLSILKEKDINMYIVTSKPEKYVNNICKKQGIYEYFSDITGLSSEGGSLPKAERMKCLMIKYGITAQNGIMVGDRPEDAWAAKKNSIPCIGVTYGFGEQNDLKKAGCIKLVDTISDILRMEE